MAKVSRRKPVDPQRIQQAEHEIKEYLKAVNFTVTEYTIEFMLQKFKEGRYYVPDYQRELVWKPPKQSRVRTC